MPNILHFLPFRPPARREPRFATPREFFATWLSWVAIASLLYFGAARLGLLPKAITGIATQAPALANR
jgi:hypothetical protein